MHWAADYIGKPWVPGARGPHGYDCWGLVYWVYRTRYGIELPTFPNVDAQDHLLVARYISQGAVEGSWSREPQPLEGFAVGLGKSRVLHHVGLWLDIDGGLVLHASVGGVTAQSLPTLRAFGFSRIEFYRHHGFHH